MTPDVVVDVGNSRIKWGRCVGGAITQSASLMPDDANAWQQQLTTWQIVKPAHWVVTGVHPKRRDQLTEWLRQQGHTVRLLNDPKELAIKVLLDRPDHVGIDRLLDALAANQRRESGRPAIIIDAGSAVTVDLVDGDGAFAGGVIMPGLRLMSKALHDYTALLPLVDPPVGSPTVPAKSTRSAVEAGVHAGVVGGIRHVVEQYHQTHGKPLRIFLTGGDSNVLSASLPEANLWPEMTLEGIRRATELLR